MSGACRGVFTIDQFGVRKIQPRKHFSTTRGDGREGAHEVSKILARVRGLQYGVCRFSGCTMAELSHAWDSALPDGKPNLTAPAPKTSDGKPDLSGLWNETCYTDDCAQGGRRVGAIAIVWYFDLTEGLPASDVQMTPWAAAIQAQRESRDHVDDPAGRCLLHGVPRINFRGNLKIIPTPRVTVFTKQSPTLRSARCSRMDGHCRT